MGANTLEISDSSIHHNMGADWCLWYYVGLGLRIFFYVLGIDSSFRLLSVLPNRFFLDEIFEQVQSIQTREAHFDFSPRPDISYYVTTNVHAFSPRRPLGIKRK